MSHEIELKFQVPPSSLARLRRAMGGRSAEVQHLAARYFDTEDGRLAAARCALRLRLEGATWVQTLKAEGEKALQRLEHNVPLPAGEEVRLDITRHDGTPAGQCLRQALAARRVAPLIEQWRSEVRRSIRRVRHRGATIELALDEGELAAGPARLPVCELEMELIDGPAAALLDLAAVWVQRHALWLDVRSKSERGQGLVAQAAPAPARPAALRADMAAHEAASALLTPLLQAALANAAAIAEGTAQAEHLHQLRVALRRMRAVFAAWPGLWPAEPLRQAGERLPALFERLGEARDADVLADVLRDALQPEMASAGLPAVAWPSAAATASTDAADLLRGGEAQAMWLDLLGLSWVSAPSPEAAGAGAAPLRSLLAPAIDRLARQVQREAARVEALDVEALHRLRRRIKRLRYLLDGSAALWPAQRVKAWLRRLAEAQDALGRLNDLVAARAPCRAWAAQQAPAWFAVGWLAATIDRQREALRRPMRRLARLDKRPAPMGG